MQKLKKPEYEMGIGILVVNLVLLLFFKNENYLKMRIFLNKGN